MRNSGSVIDHWFSVVLFSVLLVNAVGCGKVEGSPEVYPDSTSATSFAGEPEEDSLSLSGDSVATNARVPEEGELPEGMVYVPGGRTRIGVDVEDLQSIAASRPSGPRHMWGQASTPSFVAEIKPFLLDEHPVTVAQFRKFVEQTGFETQAENFGDAGVLNAEAGRWTLVKGATWRRPLGPDGEEAPDDHPVTQVSWKDARAYCQWDDSRLPTEVEWEHAARDANGDDSYCPWDGACDLERRVDKANTWQGVFPTQNTFRDGYRYTSPVGVYGKNKLGLSDMAGNVWEWTASWYRPYGERDKPYQPTPQSEKVQRGGSFLCNECGGFYVFARSHATPETSLFQVGFRCARDI